MYSEPLISSFDCVNTDELFYTSLLYTFYTFFKLTFLPMKTLPTITTTIKTGMRTDNRIVCVLDFQFNNSYPNLLGTSEFVRIISAKLLFQRICLANSSNSNQNNQNPNQLRI
ncbi:Hypothetical_protein [Hexamita inflata]|uniref:Hypothetical_protein n=1 Tax=Hexamita inflata TaxID=28002 RepID=A0AA86QMF4_9EUKA|nr:Hypothetical protein HINF_LOCUS49971 [Hexamita inflata]